MDKRELGCRGGRLVSDTSVFFKIPVDSDSLECGYLRAVFPLYTLIM
jgi:hypothetical protein